MEHGSTWTLDSGVIKLPAAISSEHHTLAFSICGGLCCLVHYVLNAIQRLSRRSLKHTFRFSVFSELPSSYLGSVI